MSKTWLESHLEGLVRATFGRRAKCGQHDVHVVIGALRRWRKKLAAK